MGVGQKFTRLKKNKKFDYVPRYYEPKGEGNPFKIEQRFDKFRSTVNSPRGLKAKFSNALEDIKREGDRNYNIRILVIIAVLVLIFLYIIDFDLSIFFT